MQELQVIFNGLAQGCIYGLIAMGFVLIYKATETVSFAQGDSHAFSLVRLSDVEHLAREADDGARAGGGGMADRVGNADARGAGADPGAD